MMTNMVTGAEHRAGYTSTSTTSTSTSTSTSATSPSAHMRHGPVTAVVCLALAAVVAAMSSLNVAIPDIAKSTHASQTELSWIIDAYSLAFAALLLPAGALGDRFGRRRALLIGLTIFGGASFAAMCFSEPHVLIGLRAVIGVGASLVMPATLSTITGTFPAAQRTKAVSVWAAVAGGSAVLGVLASGLLLEVFSWRSVFGVSVVLAIIAFVGTWLVVPESADPDAPRVDYRGAVLAVFGLVSLVYTIIEAPDAGWLGTRTLVGLGLAAVVLAVFVVVELHTDKPMLDPRIFTHRGLSAGSLSIFIQFFTFMGFMFLMLQYLQLVRRDSALIAALSILPIALTMMPISRTAPVLAARFGTRRVCSTGLVLIAAALVIVAQVSATTGYWVLAGALSVLGAGMAAAMTPATSSITAALPSAQQGVASAMNDLSREVGGAVGIAVLGSIMTAAYRSNLSLPGLPSGLVDKARDSIAVAAHAGGRVADSANSAFLDGMHIAFYAAAGAALVAAVIVTVLLRDQGSHRASRRWIRIGTGLDCPPPQSSHEAADSGSRNDAVGRQHV